MYLIMQAENAVLGNLGIFSTKDDYWSVIYSQICTRGT